MTRPYRGQLPLVIAFALSACASSAHKRSTPTATSKGRQRLTGPADTQHWSAANSEASAKRLATSLLQSRGLKALRAKLKRAPLLHFGLLRNRSSEQINSRRLMQLIEKQLARKGLVAAPKSTEAKADLILTGYIFGHNDARGGRALRARLVRLDALLAATGEKIWVGAVRVRKLVVHPSTKWRDGDSSKPDSKAKPVPPPKVTRLGPEAALDLSGGLDDRDLRLVAYAAGQAATQRWLKQVKTPPIVKLYPLRNRSSQHLDLSLLLTELEIALLASAKVRLVAGSLQTQVLRALARSAGRAPAGELAPTALINGEVTAQVEAGQARYELTLRAVRVDNQQTVWSFTQVVTKRLPPPAKDRGR
jgi:hypothetical protein